ncbi:MAG TPA: CvpA family protein [Candidatus Baltobacteraceae bacterium]|nr:CvpA family protein [Candidatus Baltobacteraceae bacterium]
MIAGYAWADIAIFVVLTLTTWRGYMRGFISELAGIVALVAALVVPWYYNGILDDPIHSVSGLAIPIAHIAGMAISGVVAYIIVLIVASFLGRVKSVPVLGLGNAMGGGVVGLIKGSILVWLILFIALYFPLTVPIRASLHQSRLAPFFVTYDENIDRAVEATIPPLVLPFLIPFFKRHHV